MINDIGSGVGRMGCKDERMIDREPERVGLPDSRVLKRLCLPDKVNQLTILSVQRDGMSATAFDLHARIIIIIIRTRFQDFTQLNSNKWMMNLTNHEEEKEVEEEEEEEELSDHNEYWPELIS